MNLDEDEFASYGVVFGGVPVGDNPERPGSILSIKDFIAPINLMID